MCKASVFLKCWSETYSCLFQLTLKSSLRMVSSRRKTNSPSLRISIGFAKKWELQKTLTWQKPKNWSDKQKYKDFQWIDKAMRTWTHQMQMICWMMNLTKVCLLAQILMKKDLHQEGAIKVVFTNLDLLLNLWIALGLEKLNKRVKIRFLTNRKSLKWTKS